MTYLEILDLSAVLGSGYLRAKPAVGTGGTAKQARLAKLATNHRSSTPSLSISGIHESIARRLALSVVSEWCQWAIQGELSTIPLPDDYPI